MTQQPQAIEVSTEKSSRQLRKWHWRDRVAETPNGCLEWLMARNEKGYGVVGVWRGTKSVKIKAHRWVYEQEVGPIPEGMRLLHSCDNPACVNPEHLTPGTQSQNLIDCVAKGRHHNRKGGKNPRVKLTEAQVSAIRASKLSSYSIAQEFGVTPGTIRCCRRGASWGHIP